MVLGVGPVLRAAVLAAAGGTPLSVLALWDLPDARGAGRFGTWLLDGAVTALWLVAAWWAVITLATVVEVLSRGRLRASRVPGCPAGLSRALLAACGVAVLTGVAAPSYAADGHTPNLPVPERPTGGPVTTARAQGSAAAHDGGATATVVVRPGDSLWRIAARHHPRADAARLVRLTARLYRTNRAVIGGDPDLIRPGSRLRLPHRPHRTDRPHRPDRSANTEKETR